MRLNAFAQVIKHQAYFAGCGQDHIEQCRIELQLGIAQFVEQVFGQVAQGDQLMRIEKTRAPLDGVKAAKYHIQQVFILRGSFQVHEFAVHIGQQVGGFHQEVLQQIFHSGEVAHFRTPDFPINHQPEPGWLPHRYVPPH